MRASTKRRQPTISHVMRAWLVVVLAAVTSSWSLAWVVPCSAHEEHGATNAPPGDRCCPNKQRASDPPAHQENGCSCPVDCSPCCGGMPASTVMTVPPISPVLLPSFTLLTFAASIDPPTDDAASDILHVPRG